MTDTTTTDTTTTTTASAWHQDVAPEIKGFWENKGLALDNPKDFAVKLTDMYRSAEKLIGVSPDQVIKRPKADAQPADVRAYYEQIGAPKEAKDYDLSPVKDATLAEAMRTSMYDKGVTKDAATAVASTVAKVLADKQTQDNAVTTAKLQEQKENLQKNWGDKFSYNHLQAIEGARRLGIDPDAVKALEGMIGYDKVMEAMRKIGANTREDTFIERGAGGPAGDVTTLEGAKSRKEELMADSSWVTKYNAGDPAAVREMRRLNQMITGVTA
jgi:hypothetical protein